MSINHLGGSRCTNHEYHNARESAYSPKFDSVDFISVELYKNADTIKSPRETNQRESKSRRERKCKSQISLLERNHSHSTSNTIDYSTSRDIESSKKKRGREYGLSSRCCLMSDSHSQKSLNDKDNEFNRLLHQNGKRKMSKVSSLQENKSERSAESTWKHSKRKKLSSWSRPDKDFDFGFKDVGKTNKIGYKPLDLEEAATEKKKNCIDPPGSSIRGKYETPSKVPNKTTCSPNTYKNPSVNTPTHRNPNFTPKTNVKGGIVEEKQIKKIFSTTDGNERKKSPASNYFNTLRSRKGPKSRKVESETSSIKKTKVTTVDLVSSSEDEEFYMEESKELTPTKPSSISEVKEAHQLTPTKASLLSCDEIWIGMKLLYGTAHFHNYGIEFEINDDSSYRAKDIVPIISYDSLLEAHYYLDAVPSNLPPGEEGSFIALQSNDSELLNQFKPSYSPNSTSKDFEVTLCLHKLSSKSIVDKQKRYILLRLKSLSQFNIQLPNIRRCLEMCGLLVDETQEPKKYLFCLQNSSRESDGMVLNEEKCQNVGKYEYKPPPRQTRSQSRKADREDGVLDLIGSDEIVLVYPLPPETIDVVSITRQDIRRLGPRRFLNDNLVDFHLKWVISNIYQNNDEFHKQFLILGSLFFTRIMDGVGSTLDERIQSGYKNVEKWNAKLNIFSKKYVIIPINMDLHWSLAIICNPSGAGSKDNPTFLMLMDSLGSYHKKNMISSYIKGYLGLEWTRENPNSSFSYSFELVQIVTPSVPKQDNGSDCGVYMLEYAERFIHLFLENQRKESWIEMVSNFSLSFSKSIIDHKRSTIKDTATELSKRYASIIASVNRKPVDDDNENGQIQDNEPIGEQEIASEVEHIPRHNLSPIKSSSCETRVQHLFFLENRSEEVNEIGSIEKEILEKEMLPQRNNYQSTKDNIMKTGTIFSQHKINQSDDSTIKDRDMLLDYDNVLDTIKRGSCHLTSPEDSSSSS